MQSLRQSVTAANLHLLDVTFACVFTIEMLVKMVAHGLWGHHNAYTRFVHLLFACKPVAGEALALCGGVVNRTVWNIVDGSITILTWIPLLFSGVLLAIHPLSLGHTW